MSKPTLSEWIYMIGDRQPAIDRNIYYDRAEESKAMEDRLEALTIALADALVKEAIGDVQEWVCGPLELAVGGLRYSRCAGGKVLSGEPVGEPSRLRDTKQSGCL